MQLSYYHTGSSRSALPPCTPSSLGCHFHPWLTRFSILKPHPQCVNWSCSRGNRERSSSGGPGTEDTQAENPSWWWRKMNGTGGRGDRKLRRGKVEEEKTIRVWTVWSWGMQQEAEVAEWKRRATKRTPKKWRNVGRRKRKGGEEGGGREKKCEQSSDVWKAAWPTCLDTHAIKWPNTKLESRPKSMSQKSWIIIDIHCLSPETNI